MASGDNVVKIIAVLPPATLSATPDRVTGGSTPAELYPVWDFDDTTVEYMDYLCYLEGYGGSGLSFTPFWSGAANTNNVRWGIGIRRIGDDIELVTGSHTYVYNDISPDDPAPSVVGEVAYGSAITFTDGADMDNWAEGELAIVRSRRTAATSNMSGDASLWGFKGLET